MPRAVDLRRCRCCAPSRSSGRAATSAGAAPPRRTRAPRGRCSTGAFGWPAAEPGRRCVGRRRRGRWSAPTPAVAPVRAAAARRPEQRRGAAAGGGAAFAPAGADHGDDAVDRNRLAFLRANLGEHAGGRRRNLGVHLVGRDLEERLVALDRVADLLDPADDRAFGDRLAHLRHHDVGCHTCWITGIAVLGRESAGSISDLKCPIAT